MSQQSKPEEFAREGETLRDAIYGTDGWYAIIRRNDAPPGQEYFIRHRPFSENRPQQAETPHPPRSSQEIGEPTNQVEEFVFLEATDRSGQSCLARFDPKDIVSHPRLRNDAAYRQGWQDRAFLESP